MDSENPIKFDIKAEESDFNCFIDAVKIASDITQTAFSPKTEKSHFVIYKFLCNKEKCSVVYDTAATKITLTARSETLEKFKMLYLKREYYKLNAKTESVAVSTSRKDAKSLTPPLQSADNFAKKEEKKLSSSQQKDNLDHAVFRLDKANASAPNFAKSPAIVPRVTDNTPIADVKQKLSEKPMDSTKTKDNTLDATLGVKNTVLAKNVKDSRNAAKNAKTTADVKPSLSKPKQPKTEDKGKSKQPQSSAGKSDKKQVVPAQAKAVSPSKAAAVSSKAAAVPPKTSSALPRQNKSEQTPAIEYKDGYSIKKYTLKRMEEALKAIKSLSGTSYKLESIKAEGQQAETKTYVIANRNGQKVTLQYMPKKCTVQLQGKRSNLFSEVQVLVSKDTDFKSAVSPHIELTGEVTSVANMQRKLKKLLPNAFDFLDEQSKIDLAIGMIDINNEDTKLSDYSSLLTPPYRGLEKFICDLQRAQGIEVKMIGQGFEKDDYGNYRLKAGYRRRIDSVVFNEVMTALYTEYFSRRNFYSHSDNTDGNAPRVITDKQEVKRIFDNLIESIDYNSKKLKEIGFSLK